MANPNPYAQTVPLDIANKLYLNGIGGPFQNQINRRPPFGGGDSCPKCGGSWESASWSPMNFDRTGTYTYTQGRKMLSTPLSSLIPANSGGTIYGGKSIKSRKGKGILAVQPLASKQEYDPIMRNLLGELQGRYTPRTPSQEKLLSELNLPVKGGYGTKQGSKHNRWLQFLKQERSLAKRERRKFNISEAAEKYHSLGY